MLHFFDSGYTQKMPQKIKRLNIDQRLVLKHKDNKLDSRCQNNCLIRCTT